MKPARQAAPHCFIHPTALIEANVDIGRHTFVWDGVHVRGPAVIGRDCIIGEKTYIAYGVRVGDRVKINAHAYLCTGVVIEDAVMIAAGVIFCNDRYPRAFEGDGETLASSAPTADTTTTVVHRGATIGAGAIIGADVEIGAYALIGMGSVVASDVPPHALVYGNPARIRGWVCVCAAPLSAMQRAIGRCWRCGRSITLTNEWMDGSSATRARHASLGGV